MAKEREAVERLARARRHARVVRVLAVADKLLHSRMKTGFEMDWTGVYKPILTVFNGGKRKTRKAKKTKTRKAKKSRKGSTRRR